MLRILIADVGVHSIVIGNPTVEWFWVSMVYSTRHVVGGYVGDPVAWAAIRCVEGQLGGSGSLMGAWRGCRLHARGTTQRLPGGHDRHSNCGDWLANG